MLWLVSSLYLASWAATPIDLGDVNKGLFGLQLSHILHWQQQQLVFWLETVSCLILAGATPCIWPWWQQRPYFDQWSALEEVMTMLWAAVFFLEFSGGSQIRLPMILRHIIIILSILTTPYENSCFFLLRAVWSSACRIMIMIVTVEIGDNLLLRLFI